jgi:hypothetical protein
MRSENMTELHFVFDAMPGPAGPRLIEVEDQNGHSIKAGEWRTRPDGLVELVVTMPVVTGGRVKPFEAFLGALKDKDADLFWKLSSLTPSDFWKEWKKVYPEDFPHGEASEASPRSIVPRPTTTERPTQYYFGTDIPIPSQAEVDAIMATRTELNSAIPAHKWPAILALALAAWLVVLAVLILFRVI